MRLHWSELKWKRLNTSRKVLLKSHRWIKMTRNKRKRHSRSTCRSSLLFSDMVCGLLKTKRASIWTIMSAMVCPTTTMNSMRTRRKNRTLKKQTMTASQSDNKQPTPTKKTMKSIDTRTRTLLRKRRNDQAIVLMKITKMMKRKTLNRSEEIQRAEQAIHRLQWKQREFLLLLLKRKTMTTMTTTMMTMRRHLWEAAIRNRSYLTCLLQLQERWQRLQRQL